MAIFGKAMGNGYAITAIIGKKEIMKFAESTFISSTFWTERIGPTAAIKTLEVMEREKTWDIITNIGLSIRNRLKILAGRYELNISIWGIPALTGFTIISDKSDIYKTLITQEMLKRGFLAGNSIYVCTEHKQDFIDEYFYILENVFKLIKEIEDGRDIKKFLKNEISQTGFRRLV